MKAPAVRDIAINCLDLRLLHAFIAVAQEGQIGRAARRLSIAQSPLSRQIIRLEKSLGVRLFERERQGVRMTHAGRVLLREAPGLLYQSNLIAQRTRDAARAERASSTSLKSVAPGCSPPLIPPR